MPITDLKGVGVKKAQSLLRLGIETKEDLLYFYPRGYENRSEITPIMDIKPGASCLVYGEVVDISKSGYKYGSKQVLHLRIKDESSCVEVVFFHGAYFTSSFKKGEKYFFYGTPTSHKGIMQVVHPVFGGADMERGLVPLYPITSGLSQTDMRKWQRAVRHMADEVRDFLPQGIRRDNLLPLLSDALKNIHFPSDIEALTAAKERLIFDELFLLSMGLTIMKGTGRRGIAFKKPAAAGEIINKLSFELTPGQRRSINEIMADMESDVPMNRLLQGDVGSGKTAVAQIALYKAAVNGFQGAFMAPTDVLMKQHYSNLKALFTPMGIKLGYLSGNMDAKEKKRVLEDLRQGKIQIIVGTHAIIQPNVEFKNLGLVITDEQHRFGVNQRIKLASKGEYPDVLIMTATPIPRTLAVVLYGEMGISVIDGLPKGRKQILTKAVSEQSREKVYKFLGEEIERGRQAYVVCSLIDNSDVIQARSATSVYKELKRRFNKSNVELLHGALKEREKDSVIQRFYRGEVDVLVSTVVIEVGIHVENATVMVIENAERFGLAQLHQLRGRVGRGKDQSYCVLITDSKNETAIERAKVMTENTDGFYIAEKDLELRGPGEFFGSRQHGIPDMCLVDLITHGDKIDQIRKEAVRLWSQNPGLEGEEFKPLKKRLEKFFDGAPTLRL